MRPWKRIIYHRRAAASPPPRRIWLRPYSGPIGKCLSRIFYFEINNFARGVFSGDAAAKYIISKCFISQAGHFQTTPPRNIFLPKLKR